MLTPHLFVHIFSSYPFVAQIVIVILEDFYNHFISKQF